MAGLKHLLYFAKIRTKGIQGNVENNTTVRDHNKELAMIYLDYFAGIIISDQKFFPFTQYWTFYEHHQFVKRGVESVSRITKLEYISEGNTIFGAKKF